MSQCNSRIFVKFKDKKNWDMYLDLFKLTAGETTASMREILGVDDPPGTFNTFCFKFFENGTNCDSDEMKFTLSSFWDPRNLATMFSGFATNLNKDAIVIGECYLYSYYPPICYEFYSFGGELHSYERTRGSEKHFEEMDPFCVGPKKWLGATREKGLTPEEKAFMKEVMASRQSS